MTPNTKSTMNYGELLLDYKPRVIASDREHARALRKIDALMRKRKRTAAENKLLDLLVTLVERYDEQHYPVGQSSAAQMLAFLIEQREISQAQLARDVGVSRRMVTEIIAGRTAISSTNVRRFADYFGVAVELFIPSSDAGGI